jgi:hypothetical protein
MTGASGTDPLDLIREIAREYEVFGELGRRSDEDVWFLARKEGDQALVALRLLRRGVDEWGDPIHECKVARELGSEVSAGQGSCSECGAPLRTFARFCGICGADQTKGLQTGGSPDERRALLDQVRAVASDLYEVLGEMPQAEGGGVVYFALQRGNRQLVRLRLREGAAGMDLGETEVGMALNSSVTVTPIRPRTSLRTAAAPAGAAPLGVTHDPPVRIRISGRTVEPARPPEGASAPPPAPPLPPRPEAEPGPGVSRERLLTYAVIALGVVVLIETLLLLRN